MILILILFYVLLCNVIAFFGRRYRLGYWGYFFLSLFLTPLAGLIALIAATPIDSSDKCRQCCEELERERNSRKK